ncbi:hypothetical protein CR513_44293, partial [Mucuna pruriens]
MDVYALLIYGVDLVVVDAFLAKRDRGENFVIAILANTYYFLNYCYGKNGKALRCCTSLLYLWLTTHRRLHWSWIKTMTKAEWTKQLIPTMEQEGGHDF